MATSDFMFLSIDPSFEIATRAVAELRRLDQLEIKTTRLSEFKRVKSGDDKDPFYFHQLIDFSRRCGRIKKLHDHLIAVISI